MGKSYDAIHDHHIGRFTITDYHGKRRMLTVPEVFMYSSNIGSARMALEAGVTRQRDFLGRLGLLKPVTVEFDEVSRPHFPAQWREVNVITIAYGHGISVSPLHVATAVSAIVNGGTLRQPTVLKVPPGTRVPGDRVVSEKTSEQMRKLMRLVVENGTAKFAAGARVSGRRQDRHGGKECRRPLSGKEAAVGFCRRFPDARSALRGVDHGGRAARHQGQLRLCDGGLDGRAGDEPYRPADRADPRRRTGRPDLAGDRQGDGGGEPSG